jgi:hypothetical protein
LQGFDSSPQAGIVVLASGGKPRRNGTRRVQVGKKDGKPNPNDVGSNMKITVSKKTQKEIQNNQNNNKKKKK